MTEKWRPDYETMTARAAKWITDSFQMKTRQRIAFAAALVLQSLREGRD
jgi:hypothetical protein